MKILSQHDKNGTSQRRYQIKLLFAITVVATSFIITGLTITKPFKIYWPDLKEDNILNNEIAVPYFQQNKRQHFSKFRCTGPENNIESWQYRLCVFCNVCYNNDDHRFYYFRFPKTEAKPIFYDSTQGMLFQFGKNNDSFGFLSLSPDGATPWTPVIANETYPIKNFVSLHQLHTILKNNYGSSNIAHGLWEEFGSVSYSMERMNVISRKLVIMHVGQIPNTPLFRTYQENIIPALSQNSMVEFELYVRSFRKKYVCFETLIVGGQLSVFQQTIIKENHGREALFYNWRSKIILHNGLDPKFVPRKHHIVITNKSHSIWTHPGAKRHRAIVNLEEVEKFIGLTYPTIFTEVVEWHTIPFKKQIEKLLDTTILITPCGGVSMIIPMLPHGAHTIVMDYYVNVPARGFKIGQSASMEGAFLNHFPHVRKQYYQVYGPQDYEFDYPEATDARESASIIVNMTRLRLLINNALEEMTL
jgi:hypothetical protein